ncbi:MAG: helix-turn-helix transcriptional regulator [Betaproteobacteria bacterium]
MPDSRVAAANAIGRAIRAARVQRRIAQSRLAQSIGVSRSTLNHIEHFDGSLDVGVLKFVSAAQEVGVQLGVHQEPPVLMERRLERERAAARAAAAREKHYRIAAALALGDPAAVSSLRGARAMVRLWRERKTCSEEYIRRWSGIVDGSPRKAAKGILRIPPGWANALFQNTPFGSAERSA